MSAGQPSSFYLPSIRLLGDAGTKDETSTREPLPYRIAARACKHPRYSNLGYVQAKGDVSFCQATIRSARSAVAMGQKIPFFLGSYPYRSGFFGGMIRDLNPRRLRRSIALRGGGINQTRLLSIRKGNAATV
jgi:hypothetical protein